MFSLPPRALLLLLALLALAALPPAHAQAPDALSYQGFLTDPAGAPLDDAGATLTFRLYDAPTGGSALWAEAHTGVAITEGRYGVILGSEGGLGGVTFDRPLWLEVEVQLSGDASGTVLAPRTALASAPYALGLRFPLAGTASTAGTAVFAVTNTATSGDTDGLHGETDSPSGRGVVGVATAGTGYGVSGEAQGNGGRGVSGWASATSGTNYGVYGLSASTSGRGVYGLASAQSGTTYGVYGRVNSSDGYAGYFTGGRGVLVDGALEVGTGATTVVIRASGGDIEVEAGNSVITIDGTTGDVTITGARDVEVAAQRDLRLSADQNLALQAGQNLTLQAGQGLSADAHSVSVEATTSIGLTAQGGLNLHAVGTTDIEGSFILLNNGSAGAARIGDVCTGIGDCTIATGSSSVRIGN